MKPPPGSLDPREASASAAGQAPIPAALRARMTDRNYRFGYCPDFEALRPADIVLCRSLAWHDFGGMITAFAQDRKGVGKANAFWSHAALYLGNNRVVEAMPPRIRIWNLSDYVPSHVLKVRRFRRREDGRELSDSERFDVCIEACARLGQDYSRRQLIEIARDAVLDPRRDLENLRVEDEYICSHLIFDAYRVGCSVTLASPVAADLVRPADLAASLQLEDVAIGWRPIQ